LRADKGDDGADMQCGGCGGEAVQKTLADLEAAISTIFCHGGNNNGSFDEASEGKDSIRSMLAGSGLCGLTTGRWREITHIGDFRT